MKRFRVAIVEPSLIIAEGVRSMLSVSEYEVVAVVSDVAALLERFAVIEPDVVIVGTQVECGSVLRSSYHELQGVALVALQTTVRSEEWLRQFDGVVNIYCDSCQLLRSLRKAVEQSEINPYDDSHDLSEREQDVLVLVAKGLANKEIADRLNISVHTVISHRKNISHKTGIKSVAGLTVYALLHNLLGESDVV